MQGSQDAVANDFALLVGLLPNLVAAGLVVLVTLAIGRLAARAIDRITHEGESRSTARLTKRLVTWSFGLVGLALALQILGLTAVATSLLATGGLVAVVLGFAFKEIGENLLAGLVLGLSRSFELGDLIESSGFGGEVKAIELRYVHVRTGDGRDVFIPSASILRNALVNLTRDGLRRGDFTVGIDYGESLEQALELVLAAARSVEGVLEDPALRVRVEEFEPQFVALRILFWINTDEGASLEAIRSDVMRVCLDSLRAAGMTVSSDVSTALTLPPLEVRVES